jgi:D-alanyl-D-alanine carboxypeptidase
VIRVRRRPAIAFALGVVVVAGWLWAPLLAAPAGSSAQSRSSGVALTDAAGPIATASQAPLASVAAQTSPAPSVVAPASARPGVPTAVIGAGPGPIGIPQPRPASATPQVRAALDARLEALRKRAGIPGISAAIVFPDGTRWQGTAGLADVAAGRPVTADTAFPVASVSKTFTAALILGLVQDGTLDLDASARSYLPSLPIDSRITIRELLDHTSGLRDFFFGAGVDHALLSNPTRTWDPARSLKYLGKPYAKPGVSWHYSNTNYLVLGMIAEAVGHATVAEQLRARFLGPLGLDHTFYQAVEKPRGPLVHDYRFLGTAATLPAIDLWDGTGVVPFTSVVTAAGGAGSIATTATDLAAWARALYGGDALDRATRDAMFDDVLRTAKLKPAIGYGLGVQSVTVDGFPAVGHSGRYLGARAVFRWLPVQGVGIAVLTNQSRSDPNPILASLLKIALTPPSD